MNIVFATAEMKPFAKTGGLGDVCASLPIALARKGHAVKIFLPKYSVIDTNELPLTEVLGSLTISMGKETARGKVYAYDYEENVEVFFIENNNFFKRDSLYGTKSGDYEDNDKRFIFYQRAVLETLKHINLKPDVLHCHDWQAALLPIYIKTLYKDVSLFRETKTFLTIHNMAYQGVFSPEAFIYTGLGQDAYAFNKMEFYGKISFLKGGLLYADVLTTVSARYAREIQCKEFGCGLQGILRDRQDDLYGIVNGIDLNEWNSETDAAITVNFSVDQLFKKYINKAVLQKENNLAVDRDMPLIGMVTRLVDQKGLDILVPIMSDLAEMNLQFILLGIGEEKYNKKFTQLGQLYPDHFGINILFDDKMARRIYAGADIFLMPSRFEPCGLGQLIALRYGTVPIVRETGGLDNTVIDYNTNTGKGNGIIFSEYSTRALLKAIEKAVSFYKDKEIWNKIIGNGIQSNFSWDVSAGRYIKLYKGEKRKDLIHA